MRLKKTIINTSLLAALCLSGCYATQSGQSRYTVNVVSGDKLVPAGRFKYLTETFGEKFVGISIDSSSGNPHKSTAHSVLTRDYVDDKDHPTYQAFQKVLALFKKQLCSVPANSDSVDG